MKREFRIGERAVGAGHPAFITAEIGLNHDGDPAIARELICAAARCGADAVKMQVFKADAFMTADIAKADYQEEALPGGEPLIEMWRRLEFSPRVLGQLRDCATELGLIFYGSAFDEDSISLLVDLGVPVLKVASGEVTNLPLLRKMAVLDLPIIMSVGMASQEEIAEAIAVLRKAGSEEVALLHSIANYPARVEDLNLLRMKKLEEVFDVPVGYSDHTTSHWGAIAAAALGARFIEKHVTMNKDQPGTDHVLSADPPELKALVQGVRAAECALGSGELGLLETEDQVRTLLRRSVVAAEEIAPGEKIRVRALTTKRPATGIAPKFMEDIAGRTAKRKIQRGAVMRWEDLDDE